MHPDVDGTPAPKEALTGRVVYDLVYNPPVTALLAQASRAGCRTLGGLDMLDTAQVPTSLAGSSVPSDSTTRIESALPTTWLLVAI